MIKRRGENLSSSDKDDEVMLRLAEAMSSASEFIARHQRDDGALPWFFSGKLDPWDHSEALMALSVSGEEALAQKAFSWLEENQNNDGSWFAQYFGDKHPDQSKKDTNFIAYPAAALWHHYLCFRKRETVDRFYNMVSTAINYVCDEQHEEGDVNWAVSCVEKLPVDALVTACSGILISLQSAISLAELLGDDLSRARWQQASERLRACLHDKPERFDRTWESKSRFSMDWFYPVMAGVYDLNAAKKRLSNSHRFVVEGLGCKCVADQPWITVAESCEYAIALLCIDDYPAARGVLAQLLRFQDDDGGFWTGYNYDTKVIWPQEKTLWTAGAFILACDKLLGKSKAQGFFTLSA